MDRLVTFGFISNYLAYYQYAGRCRDLMHSLCKPTWELGKEFPLLFEGLEWKWDTTSKGDHHCLSNSILTHSGQDGWSTSLVEGPVYAGDKIVIKITSSVEQWSFVMIGLASKQIPTGSYTGRQEKSFGYCGLNGCMQYFDETVKASFDNPFGKKFNAGDQVKLKVGASSVEFLINDQSQGTWPLPLNVPLFFAVSTVLQSDSFQIES